MEERRAERRVEAETANMDVAKPQLFDGDLIKGLRIYYRM